MPDTIGRMSRKTRGLAGYHALAWAGLIACLCAAGCKKVGRPSKQRGGEGQQLVVAIHQGGRGLKGVALAEQLLTRGAAINVEVRCPHNHGPTTPLVEAIRARNEAMVELLLRRGAKVDFVNHQAALGWTPLHYAIDAGQYYVIERIIAGAAKLDVADRYGRTPLHLAAASDKPGVVKLLLKKGAKVNLLDKLHRTPLDEANYERIRELLIRAGGKRGRAMPEASAPAR